METPRRRPLRAATLLAWCWVLTVVAVAIYAPIANSTLEAVDRAQSRFGSDLVLRVRFVAMLLIPPCSALGATIVMAQ